MIPVRREILKMRRSGLTWRAIARAIGVNPGIAWKIANLDHYEPKSPALRLKLGYPALIPTPACPRCGIVHVRRTCPKPRRYRSLFDIPAPILRIMLDFREDW